MKPKKPRAPSKNQQPPNRMEIVRKFVVREYHSSEIVLVQEFPWRNYEDDTDENYDELPVYDVLESLTESDLLKIKSLLPANYHDFKLEYEYCERLDDPTFTVKYTISKNQQKYDEQLKQYNNRFQAYTDALKQYEIDLEAYNFDVKNRKIQALQKELDVLKSGE